MPRLPTSTYRLQLNAKFTFDDAANIAAYLKGLGISHVYCSPYLQAAPGSMHGYDVVDHQRVNDELGGEEGHHRFCARLAELGLGQILDIVPNHMAVGARNQSWWDVLENGPSSRFATWFDIDWHSSEVKLQNKVLIPVLGDQYGRILAGGQIQIDRERGFLCVRYREHLYPLAPRSVPVILDRATRHVNSPTLSFLSDSLMRLPLPEMPDLDEINSRHRDKVVIYDLLQRFCDENPEAMQAVDRAVRETNADCDALDELLNLQHYRLAYWRTADQELGYRRFFDVNSLVGVRVERPHVFDATHRRILDWLQEGILDGVRIDHPDGLRDPLQYFARLRQRCPEAWIIAEKILQPGETFRENWPIQGTTGYDFLNLCNRWLTHPEGLKEVTQIYRDFTHEPTDFAAIAHEKKLSVAHEALGSDVNRLASLFVEICESNRDRRDYTRAEIRRAIREVGSSFSVYRTYVVPDRNEIADEDSRAVQAAVDQAKGQRPDLDGDLFEFIGEVLLLRSRGPLETEFVQRFQQFTSPVIAKGLEDTAFYCYNRMIGLNEVGSAPELEAPTTSEFLEYCMKMQLCHPSTMTTLSTHDTKRSDDVRARLAVITEVPKQWKGFLRRWSRSNASYKIDAQPDRNAEYFLYQTMIGAWPIDCARLTAYMEKAVREAKQHTSWSQPNVQYEKALAKFIECIYASVEFVDAVEQFVSQILMAGRVNSLTQTLLKCTAPGIPDTYQGGELWDLHLVDPDNRGPIDYATRRSLLSELESGIPAEEIMGRMNCGLPKLWLLYCALKLRRLRPELFAAEVEFQALSFDGRKADHALGYLRAGKLATIVPRWPVTAEGNWLNASVDLPGERWRNMLTDDTLKGGRIALQSIFKRFPVALLIKEED